MEQWNPNPIIESIGSPKPVTYPEPSQTGQRYAKPSKVHKLSLGQMRSCWMNSIRPKLKIVNQCFIIDKVPTKLGGYCQINIDGSKYAAHVIAYTLWYRQYRPDWHVSHLCSNPLCCNPSHLYQESQTHNEARKNCISNGCYTSCPHIPKCIGHTHV